MADVGVRGYGATPEEAFAQAALALTAVVTDPASVRCETEVAVRCAGEDRELLLVDFLNAVVFEMATRHMLFARFAVRLDAGGLEATIAGEPTDRERHSPAVEVKGATYTELAVRQLPDGVWLAQCVLDV